MRLNNQTREKIVNAFRQKACTKEQAALDNQIRALILKAYHAQLPQDVQNALRLMPVHLVHRQICVRLCWLDEQGRPHPLGKFIHGWSSMTGIDLHDPIFHNGSDLTITDKRMIVQGVKLYEKAVALREKKRQAIRELDALVKSCLTVERLEELWPEGKKLLKEFKDVTDGLIEKAKPPVPAIVSFNKSLLKEVLA